MRLPRIEDRLQHRERIERLDGQRDAHELGVAVLHCGGAAVRDEGRGAGFVVAGKGCLANLVAECGGQAGLSGRDSQEALLLADGVGQDEIGRDDARAGVLLHPLGFLGELTRHGADAGQVGLGIGLGLHLVLAVEELGD